VAGGATDHLALEASGACPGLGIAVPVEAWAGIGAWSVGQMTEWLKRLALGANLGRFRKATRGPKKPMTPRTRFPGTKHIATARLFNGEQTRCVERDGLRSNPVSVVRSRRAVVQHELA
jgi:hypothetical protein